MKRLLWVMSFMMIAGFFYQCGEASTELDCEDESTAQEVEFETIAFDVLPKNDHPDCSIRLRWFKSQSDGQYSNPKIILPSLDYESEMAMAVLGPDIINSCTGTMIQRIAKNQDCMTVYTCRYQAPPDIMCMQVIGLACHLVRLPKHELYIRHKHLGSCSL